MIPVLTIDGSAHGIANQTVRKRGSLDFVVQLDLFWEWLFGGPIRHQFHTAEKPDTADVSDVGILA